MPFKRKNIYKEPPELVSLIDMIFILLVFFLVTSFAIKMPLQERALVVPTPENKTGRAQILIQIVNDQRYFWIDEQATRDVIAWEKQLFYLPDRQKDRDILKRLARKFTMSAPQFNETLRNFVNQAKQNRQRKYFTIIRCPDEIPYIHVMEILSQLSQAENVEYGCLGGGMNEILESQISRGQYQGKQVLRIDL